MVVQCAYTWPPLFLIQLNQESKQDNVNKLFENLLSCYFETICDLCLGIIQKHPIRAEFNFTINQSEQSNWSHDRLKTNNRVQSIIANCRQECNVYVGERWIDAKSQHKIIS